MFNTTHLHTHTGRSQTNLVAVVSKPLILVACCLAAARLFGQPAPFDDQRFWMPDGPVNAILPVGNTVYISGDFSYVGPRTGPAALFDQTTGNLLTLPPRISNALKAVVPDGSGGWFIGGTFTNIGGAVVTNVAHLNADLSLDRQWNARIIGTTVNALALNSGTLYVGGSFTRVGGQTISSLVGLSASNAAVQWNPQVSGTVNAMQATNGLLYIGGSFFGVGNSNRNYLAAISTSTALANAWDPEPDAAVFALYVFGNTVYVGGQFANINNGAKSRNRLAALDATTGVASTWNPNPSGIVRALAAVSGTVYVGGDFTGVNVSIRRGFAALSSTTGAAQALDLQLQSGATVNLVNSIILSGNSLYVGGQFTNALGAPHTLVVGIDIPSSSSLPTPLGSSFNGAAGAAYGAYALAAANGSIFVAGDFRSIGGVSRQRAAALALDTGAPLSWSPGFDAPVMAMAYGANSVFIGGSFTNIITPTKTNFVNSLAAVDPVSGSKSAFSFPATNAFSPVSVNALAFGNNTLYVGGAFTVVGSQSRRFLAAVDPVTGLPNTTFNAGLGGGFAGVVSLALGGGTNLYVAGDFTTVNGVSIPRLAAVSVVNGAAVNWVPNPNQPVNVLTATSDSLYVGGNFSSISGLTSLRYFAGFSLADNSVLFVDASLPSFSSVNAMAATETVIYVGGAFTALGGNNCQNLGCMGTVGTSGYDWNPSPDVAPNTIVLTDKYAFVGGSFHTLGQSPTNQPDGYFTVFDRAPQTTISRSGVNAQITTTTGDRTDAVLQASPTLINPVWANIDTNTNPGFSWTRPVQNTLTQQYFRVVAR
jgi:hypothetical protein